MDLATSGHSTPEKKVWISPDIIRYKNPAVDLRLAYGRVFRICMAITFTMLTTVAIAFPKFEASAREIRRVQHVISVEDIPETKQIKRPPPPARPAVPIETESAEVPDDVTIESTDLDFDEISFEVPPPPSSHVGEEAEAEEIVEFWAVEKAPVFVKGDPPIYPELAVKAEIEGVVFVQFVVGKDGRVYNPRVVKGPPIFHDSAIKTVSTYVFKPAVQNDQHVSVYMTQPIRFRLANRL